MATIVAVHGIGQQFEGAHTLAATWLPALRSGLQLAGETIEGDGQFAMAFYGDLFRATGKAGLQPNYEASDLSGTWESNFLEMLSDEASTIEPTIQRSNELGKARTPLVIQRALVALSQSRFFHGIAQRALIGDLKQVSSYMNDSEVRAKIQSRLAACIGPDTRVLIGHSLGSVVAYECLAASCPEWNVKTLVTLGSPLGIRNLIFDWLRPAPKDGVGVWPRVAHWYNIADKGDIVALNKNLARFFGSSVQDFLVHNGATAHDASPYLTAIETGRAIATGLVE